MPETVDIPISDLLFDQGNARLPDESASQQDAALELARQQLGQLVNLAADIVENGLDPLSLTAVVATGDRRKRYIVMEGNRRLLALRALETPALVNPVLPKAEATRLAKLARRYADAPIATARCVRFETEDEALHWIALRHTGEREGAGVKRWGSAEQDRFTARHRGVRRPGGQVLDFVARQTGTTPTEPIITTLDRLLTTPHARRKLGVDLVKGQVVSRFPAEKVARSLGHVVEDMRSGRITVRDVYGAQDRAAYVDSLPANVLPDPATALPAPVALGDLDDTAAAAPASKATKRRPDTRRPASQRTTIIPRDAPLDVTNPRINSVFEELSTLTVETYPNAGSVLLRVFVELSVDHFIAEHGLMTDAEMRNSPLAKRLKETATHLAGQGRIPEKLRRAIERVADGGTGLLAPAVSTMHQYVHNEYVHPRPPELYAAWDELSPLMAELWPR